MSTIKFSRPVVYYSGVTQFSQKPAILTWTTDDRLIVDVVDAVGSLTQRVMDEPIKGLKVRGNLAFIYFVVNGKKVRIDFSVASRMVNVAAGVASIGIPLVETVGSVGGLYAQNELIKSSGVLEFLADVKAAGAKVKYWNFRSAMIFGVIVGVAFIALFVGIAIYANTHENPFR